MRKAIITANDLSIGYPKSANRGKNILYTGLSFKLFAGELTCLIGPNGAGKSTLLRTLSAMQKPIEGSIILNDKPLENYSESELSHQLGLVLTDKTSAGGLTVSQLVALGRYPYTGFFGRLNKHDREIIEKSMQDVGISHKQNEYVAELSDGERQKAMIAKALAQECPVVFLDEPTAFLDVVSRIEMMDLLHHLAYTQEKTILLSTHDIELALLLADRLWLMSRENGLETGITEDILLNNTMETFLARNNIAFDKQTGSFFPDRTYKRCIYVESTDPNLLHWTKNFMRRNYWEVTDELSDCSVQIVIVSLDEIQVIYGSQKRSFSSFNGLHNWLYETFPSVKEPETVHAG